MSVTRPSIEIIHRTPESKELSMPHSYQARLIDSTFAAVERSVAEQARDAYLAGPKLGDAGFDLRYMGPDIRIEPGATVTAGTGLAVWIRDPNLVGLCYPRSGLGSKQGIVLANLTGVIDSNYQGEIKVVLWNRGRDSVVIKSGERVCQLVIQQIVQHRPQWVNQFDDTTERGEQGFGHSGTH